MSINILLCSQRGEEREDTILKQALIVAKIKICLSTWEESGSVKSKFSHITGCPERRETLQFHDLMA